MAEADFDSRDELGHLMEGCRQYLLMVANQAMTPDLRAKVGASDVVQETFLVAQRGLGDFRGRTRAELLAWLRRILECRLANVRRSFFTTRKRAASREVTIGDAGPPRLRDDITLTSRGPSPSNHAIRGELAEALERAIDRLPEHYRNAVVWRHREQLGFSEIGARLDCSTEAARKVWNRAIYQLRQELDSLG